MIESCLVNGHCTDVIRSVASLICIDELQISVFWGRCSSFEHMSKPHTPSDGPFRLDIALAAVDYLLIKLPRLTCLVRSVLEQPFDTKAHSTATSTAEILYNSNEDLYIQSTLRKHTRIVKCLEGTSRSPTGETFDFDGLNAFVLDTRYYLYRTLLCGLIQALDNFAPNSAFCNNSTAEQEDLSAATSISMCVDYAFEPTRALPLKALGVVIPIQLGLGAWHRLQHRQSSTDAEYQRALLMKRWSLDRIQYLAEMWHVKPVEPKRMELVCEMFAGGPLIQDAYVPKQYESALDNISTETHCK